MSTLIKDRTDPMSSPPGRQPRDDRQLRRDRMTAVIVLAVLAASLAFILWLASLSGGAVHEGIDYWPMMP